MQDGIRRFCQQLTFDEKSKWQKCTTITYKKPAICRKAAKQQDCKIGGQDNNC